jgi:dihydrofolate reductase
MNFIAAVDANWGIGNKGRLLARIKEDQKFFKETTMGHVVVLGRKTLEEFPGGKPLSGRTNIILSRNTDYVQAGAVVAHSLSELSEVLSKYDSDDIFVIGGQSIYDMLIPYCDTAYITKIEHEYEADAYITNLDKDSSWEKKEKIGEGEAQGIMFSFWKYENENVKKF